MRAITETFYAPDRDAWREWLREHHSSRTEIWLVVFKKRAGKACVNYDDAVEEALCFGWIDGMVRRIDDEKHAWRFTPRKARSIWSDTNKHRVEQMIESGRMTESGMALVRAAKASGDWERSDTRARTGEVPEDLDEALAANPRAMVNFNAFAPGYRATYIAWVNAAKRAETRRKRIERVVSRSAQNTKPGIDM